MSNQPEIQLIANLVITDDEGRVLLARHNPSGEPDDDDADRRWWLPAHELDAYQHPDDAARRALDEIGGLDVQSTRLAGVQSFRGRRGWHLSFDYHVTGKRSPSADGVPAEWHAVDDLPPTMHGNWERDTIHRVLASSALR